MPTSHAPYLGFLRLWITTKDDHPINRVDVVEQQKNNINVQEWSPNYDAWVHRDSENPSIFLGGHNIKTTSKADTTRFLSKIALFVRR